MTGRDRLSVLADVHVPRAFVTALRADGFDVTTAQSVVPPGTDDVALLGWANDHSAVRLTNGRDFARLHDDTEHTGIIVYTSQSLDAATFRRGVRRIDRQCSTRTMANTLCWLDEWV